MHIIVNKLAAFRPIPDLVDFSRWRPSRQFCFLVIPGFLFGLSCRVAFGQSRRHPDPCCFRPAHGLGRQAHFDSLPSPERGYIAPVCFRSIFATCVHIWRM
jgi:hypothetical protein